MNRTTTKRRFKETPGGWLDLDSGHTFKAAANAMSAAKRESKRNATGGMGAVVIEWEPTTRLGRIVIEAIQGN